MELKSIFIIIVDISGYTRFIKKHRVALLHAEKIIDDLMESILDTVQMPVVAHEILGDALSLYAKDSGSPGLADEIYNQTLNYFQTFREKEASLISDCQVCNCEACGKIGKLKLKAILHFGQVAFTKVKDIQKISGENVILSHRLLKNSVPSDEYILMTSAFAEKCQSLSYENNGFEQHTENCEGIGPVQVVVKSFKEKTMTAADLNLLHKLYRFLSLSTYTMFRMTIGRIFSMNRPEYRNLPY